MSDKLTAITPATLPLAGTELTYVVQGGNSRSAPVSAYINANLTAWSAVNPSAYLNTSGIAAAYQPLDADLTAIAALTTTAAGRNILTLASNSAIFDAVSPTTTRGDLIFRNATTNARLAASTAGYHLQTNGAGTDPTYAGFAQPVGSSPSTRTWQDKASDYASIIDYGGIGDGLLASAVANATALTNALATGKKVWIPYTSAGYHFGTNAISVGTGQVIEGENQVLLKSTSTTFFLGLTGFDTTSGIHNVSIDMTGSGASSTAIRFRTNSGTPIYRVRLSKIRFANCVEAIGDEVHATNYIVDVIIDDCMAWKTRGRQMYIRRSRGFFLIRSTNVDFTQDTIPVAWEGIRLEDFAGLELERVDVVGWGQGSRAYNAAIYGIVISTGQALWLTRVFVDSYLGVGIFINAASYVFSNYLETSLCNGLGILMTTVSKGVFANTLINGNTGITGAAAGAQGLYLDTVTDCTFTTTLAYNMTGSGIAAVTANNRVTFTGTVTNTNGFGIAIQGTSANVQFLGGSMTGNSTTISNTASGTGNVVRDVIGCNPYGSTVGTNTNDSAQAGCIGEYVETVVATGSAVSLTSTTAANMASISLTAGDWDVDIKFDFKGGTTTTVTYMLGSLSLTTGTMDSTVGRTIGRPYAAATIFNNTLGGVVSESLPPLRLSLNATTTVYAVAVAAFGVSTLSVFGVIRARRVR